MADQMETIKALAAAAGFPTNQEMIPLWILENEVENLSAKAECKRQLVKILDENLEKKRLELKTEKEIAEQFALDARADVTKFKEKNMILIQYLSILATEEFMPNKLSRLIRDDEQEYYPSLKSFIERARGVAADIERLQVLQARCDQLRQQTAN